MQGPAAAPLPTDARITTAGAAEPRMGGSAWRRLWPWAGPGRGDRDLGPLKLLVLQSTGFCNLDCRYCYLADRHVKSRMDPALVEPIVRKTIDSGFVKGGFSLLWHAGEPLTLPPAYYEEAMARMQAGRAASTCPDTDIAVHIQTNGVLINAEWCDFIRRQGVRIGISVDGPADLHDRMRVTRSGAGTHAATLAGIKRLQDAGIPFNTITVLTAEALERPEDLLRFYVDAGIRTVGFNVEEIEGENPTSSLSRVTPEAYAQFLKQFLELSRRTPGAPRVREFDAMHRLITGGGDTVVGQFTPFSIVSVDHLGNFGTFSPELLDVKSDRYGDFLIGNFKTDDYASAVRSRKYRRLNRDIAKGVAACRQSCSYFRLCGGGAPANKYFEHGSFEATETLYCRLTKKTVADVVLDDLERQLA